MMMRNVERRWESTSVFLLWILASTAELGRAQTFPSAETAKKWSTQLERTFNGISSGDNDLTGAETFERKFQDAFNFEIFPTNGKEIASQASQDIQRIFETNIMALQNLAESVESLVRDYEYNEDLTVGNLSNYLNMVKLNEHNDTGKHFHYSSKFKQDVNLQRSGVHIPLEIYEGYPDILNGLEWSGGLDAVFKKNYEKFPELYWQSFGSQNGFLRVYPAARWQTSEEHPDLFDVRRRPWYIHGSVTPKDMIILLDTSGSMHGQSFDIMKLAAKMLINTLGEDDYFNVASFDKNVSWVTPCLNTLVQANSRNKRLIFDGIDKLEARYIASYEEGLQFAYESFEIFEEIKNEEDGAECHKLIMIFSDGGTVYPKEVIDTYKNQSMTENVRIFSYAVGPHPLPTVALKTMACETGGAFTTITAMGAIRTKVQDSYLSIIARPEAISSAHTLQITSVYADALIEEESGEMPIALAEFGNVLNIESDYARVLSKPLILTNNTNYFQTTHYSRDYLGLGLITTITYPVFNTSVKSDNQTLAGVVGIDIPVSNMESLIPRHRLGPLGYSFAINQNGFLVFHPDLWSFMNYFEDPSHVDFADVVGESYELKEVREAMINEKSGSMVVEIGHQDYKFDFVRVQNSSFSLGIVTPVDWKYIEFTSQDLKVLEDLRNIKEADIAPWTYCAEELNVRKQNLTWVLDRIKQGECKPNNVVHHLAWDVKNAKPIFESLMAQNLPPKHFPSRFVMTDGGLTIKTGLKLSVDPYNSTIYKDMVKYSALYPDKTMLYIQQNDQTAFNKVLPKYKFNEEMVFNDAVEIVTRPSSDQEWDFSPERSARIYMVKSFSVKKNSAKVVAGVSGIELSESYLSELVSDSTGPVRNDEYSCLNNTELWCTILDYSASVVYSNQENVRLGEFLGEFDPDLMKHLVDKLKIYMDDDPIINYQALCPDSYECTASGPKISPLSIYTVLNGLSTLIGFCQSFYLTFFSVLGSFYGFPEGIFGLSQYSNKVTEGLHRCTTRTSRWSLNVTLVGEEFHDRISSSCGTDIECKRDLHVYKLSGINGFFIVSNPECHNCRAAPFPTGPVEVNDGENCLLPRRYRKRQEGCYAHSELETSECSSGSMSVPLYWKSTVFILLASLTPLLVKQLF